MTLATCISNCKITYSLCLSGYLFFGQLMQLCEASGSSLGYGFARVMVKPKSQTSDLADDNQVPEGTVVA